MTRTDRYWAAIARDHAQGEVDAVTRLADEEIDAVEARVDALLDQVETLSQELALSRDTLEKRTAALNRTIAGAVKALSDEAMLAELVKRGTLHHYSPLVGTHCLMTTVEVTP